MVWVFILVNKDSNPSNADVQWTSATASANTGCLHSVVESCSPVSHLYAPPIGWPFLIGGTGTRTHPMQMPSGHLPQPVQTLAVSIVKSSPVVLLPICMRHPSDGVFLLVNKDSNPLYPTVLWTVVESVLLKNANNLSISRGIRIATGDLRSPSQ